MKLKSYLTFQEAFALWRREEQCSGRGLQVKSPMLESFLSSIAEIWQATPAVAKTFIVAAGGTAFRA